MQKTLKVLPGNMFHQRMVLVINRILRLVQKWLHAQLFSFLPQRISRKNQQAVFCSAVVAVSCSIYCLPVPRIKRALIGECIILLYNLLLKAYSIIHQWLSTKFIEKNNLSNDTLQTEKASVATERHSKGALFNVNAGIADTLRILARTFIYSLKAFKIRMYWIRIFS